MKHKGTLLVAFFLILFVFHEARAGEGISLNKGNSSPLDSAQASGLPTQVYVTMLHLASNGAPLLNNKGQTIPCKLHPADDAYGCVENYPGLTYPYGSNPVWVAVETEYLTNVMPRELDVINNYPSPTVAAIQVQALASRSVADWKYRAHNGYIDNSTNYQIFVPFSFVYYTRSNVPLSNSTDPCNENGSNNTLNILQQEICGGIDATHGQYVSYNGSSMDAEFGSDAGAQTSGEGTKSYLISVQDPISTTCGAPSAPNYSGWGMSQKGAMRWSLGNECAGPTDQNTYNNNLPSSYRITWNDYRQILVHYYTGIDILDANGSKIAPDDRWNLLSHDIPMHSIAGNYVPGNYGGNGTNEGNVYYQVNPGQTYIVNLRIQNTSASDWIANNIYVGYQWTPLDAPPQNTAWQGQGPVLTATAKGAEVNGSSGQNVSIMAPTASGIYTLHLDLEHQGGPWFTDVGWLDAEISPVYVYNYVVPIIQNGSGNTSSDDGGNNPGGSCAFSGTDNEVYLGACFNGQDITSGFRFQFPQNNGIPAGTNNIKNAYLIFSTDTYNVEIDVQISGEKSLSSPTFSTSNPPSSPTRVLTSNPIPWNITDPWTWRGTYYTPDISSIIQQIVSQPGWSTSYPISIIITNVHNMPGSLNVRRVQAYEGSWGIGLSYPAILVVNTQ